MRVIFQIEINGFDADAEFSVGSSPTAEAELLSVTFDGERSSTDVDAILDRVAKQLWRLAIETATDPPPSWDGYSPIYYNGHRVEITGIPEPITDAILQEEDTSSCANPSGQ